MWQRDSVAARKPQGEVHRRPRHRKPIEQTRVVNVFARLFVTRWRYLLHRSLVRCKGEFVARRGVVIKNSLVRVDATSSLELKEGARLEGVTLRVRNGARVVIGEHARVEQGGNPTPPEHLVDSGQLEVGDHSQLRCKRLLVRFGGRVTVGSYTNVNDGSEIRADERVEIGSYCMISYNTRIWDTNTHCLLPPEERRKRTREHFPAFGLETERPKTSPVHVGDGCWLGEGVALLKGTRLGENVTVGFGTLVSNVEIEANRVVYEKRELGVKEVPPPREEGRL